VYQVWIMVCVVMCGAIHHTCVWLIGDWWLIVTRWRSLLLEVHNVVGQLS